MQQMTEYWVNVYKDYGAGNPLKSLKIANDTALNFKRATDDVLIYRIHIKMKAKYDYSFAKDGAILAKDYNKEIVVEELWQVPLNLPVGTKVRITGPKFYNWRDIYS